MVSRFDLNKKMESAGRRRVNPRMAVGLPNSSRNERLARKATRRIERVVEYYSWADPGTDAGVSHTGNA